MISQIVMSTFPSSEISGLLSFSPIPVDVISIISNYGYYCKFEIQKSAQIQGLTHTEFPCSICQVADDRIFLSYSCADSVSCLNSRGEQVWSVNLPHPMQICASERELFVSSYGSNAIFVYSFYGILLRQFTTHVPFGIAYDFNRDQLVVSSKNKLSALGLDGQEIWSSPQPAAALLYFLDIDQKTGNIYCFEDKMSNILLYDSEGNFQREIRSMLSFLSISNAAVVSTLGELLIFCEMGEWTVNGRLNKSQLNS